MTLKRAVLTWMLVLSAACSSTGPNGGMNTIVVTMDHPVTAQDVSAVQAIGATVKLRVDLARAVAVRTARPASDFLSVAGVTSSRDYGSDDNPLVSVFITVTDTPTQADVDFVKQAGATTAYPLAEQKQIAATMHLGDVPKLEQNDRFVALEVAPGSYSPDV